MKSESVGHHEATQAPQQTTPLTQYLVGKRERNAFKSNRNEAI